MDNSLGKADDAKKTGDEVKEGVISATADNKQSPANIEAGGKSVSGGQEAKKDSHNHNYDSISSADAGENASAPATRYNSGGDSAGVGGKYEGSSSGGYNNKYENKSRMNSGSKMMNSSGGNIRAGGGHNRQDGGGPRGNRQSGGGGGPRVGGGKVERTDSSSAKSPAMAAGNK